VDSYQIIYASQCVPNQDFPCAQIRCSQCLSDGDLEKERNSCEEKSGISEDRTDHDTGCTFVYCEDSKTENPMDEEPLLIE